MLRWAILFFAPELPAEPVHIVRDGHDTCNWTSLMVSGMIAPIVINYTTCPDKRYPGCCT